MAYLNPTFAVGGPWGDLIHSAFPSEIKYLNRRAMDPDGEATEASPSDIQMALFGCGQEHSIRLVSMVSKISHC